MKKITLIFCSLFALSVSSQQLIIINNTTENFMINELIANEFCMYNFPTVQPQYDMMISPCPYTVTSFCPTSVLTPPRIVAPLSGALVADLSGISPSFDFEYINFSMIDPLSGTTILTTALSTDALVYYEPASCQPPVAPTTFPMPSATGIRQVYGPDILSTTILSRNSLPSLTGLYAFSWRTIFNVVTGKYDVEVTIN